MKKDDFGDRMKGYEVKDTFMPLLPIVIRLDGKTFSKFTKKFNKPFDIRMVQTMIDVTRFLVSETNAKIGYTQSDEITLVLHSDNFDRQVFFDGKVQKIVSVCASLATAKFNELVLKNGLYDIAKRLAFFDCRAFQVPSKEEASNAVLWRELDATKNAISCAASYYFSHKSLHKLTGSQKQERLWTEKGINFNDYPTFFKRGTYVQRKKKFIELTDEQLNAIPELHRPTERTVERTIVSVVDLPILRKVENRVGVIFYGEDPMLKSD